MKRALFFKRNLLYPGGTLKEQISSIYQNLHGSPHDELILEKTDIEEMCNLIKTNPEKLKTILEDWFVKFAEPLEERTKSIIEDGRVKWI